MSAKKAPAKKSTRLNVVSDEDTDENSLTVDVSLNGFRLDAKGPFLKNGGRNILILLAVATIILVLLLIIFGFSGRKDDDNNDNSGAINHTQHVVRMDGLAESEMLLTA